jgi:hypothetical protein
MAAGPMREKIRLKRDQFRYFRAEASRGKKSTLSANVASETSG